MLNLLSNFRKEMRLPQKRNNCWYKLQLFIWKACCKKEASLTFLAYMIQDRKDKDTDKYMGKDKDQGVGVPMFLSISDPPNVFILQGVSNVVVICRRLP